MGTDPVAPIQCRFCLESTNADNNPFIEPCECRGSVRYVHTNCLRRWIALDPAKNGDQCSICAAPFTVYVFPMLETIPELTHRGFKFALKNLGATGASLQLGIFLIVSREEPLFRTLTFGSLGIIHEMYIISFIRCVQIHDYIAYLKMITKNGLALLWLAHALLFYGMVYEDYISFSFVVYLLLESYWGFHVTTLRQINEEILNRQADWEEAAY